jgi:hypothetical protein
MSKKNALNQDQNKTKAQFKADFDAVLAKALANKSINTESYPTPTGTKYVSRNGIPHKIINGQWVPLTKIN